MDSLRIAFGVFMSGDVNEARKLLAEKAALRNTELAATERHLDRLREGRPETIETTSLHLDVLRDLRRIHSHICSVAYPVLDAAGELAAYRSAESDLAALARYRRRPPRDQRSSVFDALPRCFTISMMFLM
jgi:phosphate:Na+ symporter